MIKYTFEDFKKESIEKFGDIFDYSESDYKTKKDKIKIKCQHGHEFYRSITQQLKIGSCPICKKKINCTEDFIKESKLIHGETKFDYSLVQFKSYNDKVALICNDCGKITYQKITNNLMGKGCYNCSKVNPITEEKFLERSKKFHNDFYIYNETKFIDVMSKMTIECPIHGKFLQNATDHMRHGCPKCGVIKSTDSSRTTQEEMIQNFKSVHNDEFCYDKVNYINANTKVIIICKKHGEFLMTPSKHYNTKQKCPKCKGLYKTTEDFILASNLVHDNYYTYEKTIYVSDQTKVIVTCPKHGDFLITPNNHLRERRCKLCKESNGEKRIRIYLRDNGYKFEPQYRITECRNINPLPFDFAVFKDDGSLDFLCEFQGAQHYFAVSFGSCDSEKALKNFQDLQLRDSIKKEFCKNNSINILYITYKELDRIEEILSQQFKGRF